MGAEFANWKEHFDTKAVPSFIDGSKTSVQIEQDMKDIFWSDKLGLSNYSETVINPDHQLGDLVQHPDYSFRESAVVHPGDRLGFNQEGQLIMNRTDGSVHILTSDGKIISHHEGAFGDTDRTAGIANPVKAEDTFTTKTVTTNNIKTDFELTNKIPASAVIETPIDATIPATGAGSDIATQTVIQPATGVTSSTGFIGQPPMNADHVMNQGAPAVAFHPQKVGINAMDRNLGINNQGNAQVDLNIGRGAHSGVEIAPAFGSGMGTNSSTNVYDNTYDDASSYYNNAPQTPSYAQQAPYQPTQNYGKSAGDMVPNLDAQAVGADGLPIIEQKKKGLDIIDMIFGMFGL
jgi:hypothetical protein